MKISLIVIRCSNIETSKVFYERLGITFQKEQHGKGPEHYSSEIDGIIFELYPSKDGSPTDEIRLGFMVQDLESKLPSLNIINEYDFGGTKTFVVADPDGRKVELT